MLNELIPITKNEISGELMETVDARELWKKLEVKSRFNDWMKNRIEDAQLIEKQDYISLTKILVSGGLSTEYALTIDSAKHFAMLERNEKGKEIRQYFIDIEKKARNIHKAMVAISPDELATRKMKANIEMAEILGCPKHIAIIEASKCIEKQFGLDYTKLIESSKYMDNIAPEDEMQEPTEIGRKLGMSARDTNHFIATLGWQTKKKHQSWKATKIGEKHCVRHSWKCRGKSGYNYKWNVQSVLKEWKERSNW